MKLRNRGRQIKAVYKALRL